MVSLVIQTILLLAIAFIIGCILGCLMRSMIGGNSDGEAVASPNAATASASGDTLAAAKESTDEKAVGKKPVIPTPPVPQAPVQPVEKAQVAEPVPVTEVPIAKAKPATTKAKAAAKPKATAKAKTKTAPAKKTTAARKTAKKPAAAAGKPDNLKLIRGIGPQNEGRLNKLGIKTFAQIASWTKKEQAEYGEALAFPGRIEREEWVSQAKVLAKGGETAFAKRVESGSVSSSVGKATSDENGTKPKGLLKAARRGNADKLSMIDGVGNAIEQKMFKLGIHHFDQLAKMSKPELIWLGNQIGFPGRPERENWAGEAKVLAEGGSSGATKSTRGTIKSKSRTASGGKKS